MDKAEQPPRYSFLLGSDPNCEKPSPEALSELSHRLWEAANDAGTLYENVTTTYCGRNSINGSDQWILAYGDNTVEVSTNGLNEIDHVAKAAAGLVLERTISEKAEQKVQTWVERSPREGLALKGIKLLEAGLEVEISLNHFHSKITLPVDRSNKSDLSLSGLIQKMEEELDMILVSLLDSLVRTTENFPANVRKSVSIVIDPGTGE